MWISKALRKYIVNVLSLLDGPCRKNRVVILSRKPCHETVIESRSKKKERTVCLDQKNLSNYLDEREL